MPRPIVLVVPILLVAAAGPAFADPVRHAGEWETVIDGGKPLVVCFPADQTFDKETVLKSMSKIPGANCKIDDFSMSGETVTYALECTIGGSVMTTNGTLEQTGPDAFMTKAHTHGGAIAMPGGKTTPMPDIDSTTTSRRLGPCKPGEREIRN